MKKNIISDKKVKNKYYQTKGPWAISLTLANTEGFSLSKCIYFLLWHLHTILCNVQGRSLPGNPACLYLSFMGGDLNSFRDNRVFPV
jgi:hypothetical protein